MKILTASQMREVDELTTTRFGVPSLVLMENAGAAVAREMERCFSGLISQRIVVLCGKGNNGGDGFVVARHLIMRGGAPQVVLFCNPSELKGDALANYQILEKMEWPVRVLSESSSSDHELQQFFEGITEAIVVDALLGTGIRLPVAGFVGKVLNVLAKHPRLVAVDVPSGLDCEKLDFVATDLLAPIAELTVTFTAPKPAHVFYPAARHSRHWVVAPIGTPEQALRDSRFWLNWVTRRDMVATRRGFQRLPDSHKGDYGHVLTVGGSVGKTGAASLMSQGALLAGAGLVTLATPSACLSTTAAFTPEVMTEPLASTELGSISAKAFDYGRVDALLSGKDVVAVGPGLGTHPDTSDFVRRLYSSCPVPLVLDADGINAFAGHADLLSGSGRIVVMTPHPGEMARVVNLDTRSLLENRIELAREFATQKSVHLVLKGHRTLYASPSGQVYANSTGNAGMATAGSGDVLTGVLAGLLAQGLAKGIGIEEIVTFAVYLHGLAGDLAAAVDGEQSLVASSMLRELPAAFRALSVPLDPEFHEVF
ncbi:MAG: NAD(P)H-hydrate dehydratase [Acidobacteriota bacterium]